MERYLVNYIKVIHQEKEFFDKIIDVVTVLGGDLNDAL